MSRFNACLTGVALLSLLMARPCVGQNAETFRIGDPLPQVVLDAWQKRREACESVYWKLKARELITVGMLNTGPEDLAKHGLRPKEDEWREREFEAWVDFPTSRVRSENFGEVHTVNREGVTSLAHYHEIYLYDGKSLQKFQPDEENRSAWSTELWEQDPEGNGSGLAFEAAMMPFFWGRGIVSGPDTPFRVTALNARLDPAKFKIHAVERDGSSIRLIVRVVLRPDRPEFFAEYEIDLAKQAAIIRMAHYSGDRLSREVTTMWSETDFGWQPQSWTMSDFRLDGNLAIASECQVIESVCGADLSQVTFHMDPETGTPYWDEKTKTAYVASPGDEPDVPLGVHKIRQANRHRRLWWFLSGGLALLVAVGGTWWWRRQ